MLRFSAFCGPNEQKFGELLTWPKVVTPSKILPNPSTESWETQHLKGKKYKPKFEFRTLVISDIITQCHPTGSKLSQKLMSRLGAGPKSKKDAERKMDGWTDGWMLSSLDPEMKWKGATLWVIWRIPCQISKRTEFEIVSSLETKKCCVKENMLMMWLSDQGQRVGELIKLTQNLRMPNSLAFFWVCRAQNCRAVHIHELMPGPGLWNDSSTNLLAYLILSSWPYLFARFDAATFNKLIFDRKSSPLRDKIQSGGGRTFRPWRQTTSLR